MNRQKAPRAAGGSRRPVKSKARPDPEDFDFYEEDDFYGERSAKASPKKAKARPRGPELPFGEDRYARPARSASPAPKRAARPAPKRRAPEKDGRFYGEEVPVRKKARAQGPRPAAAIRYDRPRRDEYYDDRPGRAPARGARRRKKANAGGSALIYWAIAVVLALIIGFGVRTFGFELIKVSSDAMGATLPQGDVVLVQKSVYYAAKPARGDIVGVNSPDGLLIRRVVALPGETIEIRGGVTYVNDEALDEAYVSQAGGGDYPLTTIQEGCYFVMGDNRSNTDDSRAFGLIRNTRSLIVGKVQSVFWPPDQWGAIG